MTEWNGSLTIETRMTSAKAPWYPPTRIEEPLELLTTVVLFTVLWKSHPLKTLAPWVIQRRPRSCLTCKAMNGNLAHRCPLPSKCKPCSTKSPETALSKDTRSEKMMTIPREMRYLTSVQSPKSQEKMYLDCTLYLKRRMLTSPGEKTPTTRAGFTTSWNRKN